MGNTRMSTGERRCSGPAGSSETSFVSIAGFDESLAHKGCVAADRRNICRIPCRVSTFEIHDMALMSLTARPGRFELAGVS